VSQIRGELKEALTHGLRDFYLVIAGRRNAMRVDDRLRLGQIHQEFKNIQIITYDVIIDAWLNKALQEYRFSGWDFSLFTMNT